MGVFKEEAHTFETIANKQERIFSDTADYGYSYDSNNKPKDIQNLFLIIQNLQSLDKKFPNEKPIIRNRQTWENHDNKGPSGVSIDVIIFWEKDEGYYRGTKYHISFDRMNPNHPSLIKKGNDSIIAIDIDSYKEKA